MKVYFDEVSPEMVSTFTPGEGFDEFKSISEMKAILSAEHGDELELIELTPELYAAMYDSGEFVGYEPI